MSDAFVDVESGTFLLWTRTPWWNRPADFCTEDPKEAADFLIDNKVTSFMKSSSLDDPEDYGMDSETVCSFYEELQRRAAGK